MRRLFKEEETPARLTPLPQGAGESAVGQLPEQEASQKSAKATPSHQKKSDPVKGKLLKMGIITFASLGAISLILPALVGVPLGTLLENVSIKNAYSSTSLAHLRATTALKIGNLAGATDALLSVDPTSAEAMETGGILFLKLMEVKDYGHAAQILNHLKPVRKPIAFTSPMSFQSVQFGEKSMTPEALTQKMVNELGVEKSLALLEQSRSLQAMRSELLPGIYQATTRNFRGMSPQARLALEKLVPKLQGQERITLLSFLVYAEAQANLWDSAWRWNASLPAEARLEGESFLLREMTMKNPSEAIQRVVARKGSPEFLTQFAIVYPALVGFHSKEAPKLFQQLDSPLHCEFATGLMMSANGPTRVQLTVAQATALLDKFTDPAIKAWALHTMTPPSQEFIEKEIVTRYTELARQHPELIRQHDEFIGQKIVASASKEVQARLLAQILDPTTRVAMQKEWESGKISVKYPLQSELLENVIKSIRSRTE